MELLEVRIDRVGSIVFFFVCVDAHSVESADRLIDVLSEALEEYFVAKGDPYGHTSIAKLADNGGGNG